MKELTKIECYIEEYKNQSGSMCVRLRDKHTNKKVVLTGKNADKEHLLRFLSQAKINNSLMPTVYSRNGLEYHIKVQSLQSKCFSKWDL